MPLHPSAIPVLDAMNANMAAIPQVPVEQIPMLRQGPLAPAPTVPTPVARIEERMIPGPAGDLRVRIYWPEGEGPAPLVVFFHGGVQGHGAFLGVRIGGAQRLRLYSLVGVTSIRSKSMKRTQLSIMAFRLASRLASSPTAS